MIPKTSYIKLLELFWNVLLADMAPEENLSDEMIVRHAFIFLGGREPDVIVGDPRIPGNTVDPGMWYIDNIFCWFCDDGRTSCQSFEIHLGKVEAFIIQWSACVCIRNNV